MATILLQNQPAIQAQQQVAVTRAQVATTARAFQDLSAQISNTRDVLIAQVANPAEVGLPAFTAAWNARERLNQLHEQLTAVQTGLNAHMPSPSDFQTRLNEHERTQIRGLYASSLYTQQDLAEQYGVTQPTIARIVDRT